MVFGLYFNGSPLHKNDDGYQLIKQYNQLIKYKQYLEQLEYDHHRIGSDNDATTESAIKELIYKVDKS